MLVTSLGSVMGRHWGGSAAPFVLEASLQEGLGDLQGGSGGLGPRLASKADQRLLVPQTPCWLAG